MIEVIILILIYILIEILFKLTLNWLQKQERYVEILKKIMLFLIIFLFFSMVSTSASLLYMYKRKAILSGGWIYLGEFWLILVIISISFVSYFLFLDLFSKKLIFLILCLQGLFLIVSIILALNFSFTLIKLPSLR